MRDKLLLIAAIIALLISACGGGGGSNAANTPIDIGAAPPQPMPIVIATTLGGQEASSPALSFSEGDIITLSIDPTNSSATSATLVQTTGPEVDFGRFTVGGISSGDNLTLANGDFTVTLSDKEGERTASFEDAPLLIELQLPAVNEDTNASLAFSYTNGIETINETIAFTIADNAASSVVTISGIVSIGLISNACVVLTDASSELDTRLADLTVLAEDTTDENGRYSLTFNAADITGDLISVSVFLEDATLVCVSPRIACISGVGFGQEFTVMDSDERIDFDGSGPLPEFEDAALRAVINTPTGGTALSGNLNIFTQLSFIRMIGLANQNNSISPAGNIILRPEDLSLAQLFVANVFGLEDQDFTQLDFVDITQPITSSDQQAIRAALISSGYITTNSIIGAERNQGELIDFAGNFLRNQQPFTGSLIARFDGSFREFSISIERIFTNARELADGLANDSTSVDIDTAAEFIVTRIRALSSAPVETPVNADGTLP